MNLRKDCKNDLKLNYERPEKITTNLMIRMMISAAIDNDNNRFVVVTYTAVSFLFLWGIQIAFEYTLIAMLLFYTMSSSLEVIRLFLAYHSVDNKDDNVILCSNVLHANYNKILTEEEFEPKNVYQDLGRNIYIAFMVFGLQGVLISFVCYDLRHNIVNNCLDGTEGCPLAGTLGSWSLFILGTCMAIVFQIGPKTNYGESEQNPAYWLRLFLVIKDNDTRVTWKNHMKGNTENKLACQSSLTIVVAKVVGTMYLVDLDDSKGDKLAIKNIKNTKLDEEINMKRDSRISLRKNCSLPNTGADYNKFEDEDMIHIDKVRDEASKEDYRLSLTKKCSPAHLKHSLQ